MGALAALVAGTLDFLVVRWAWRRRLAMSPAEVRQEQREVEGLPERKSAPRQRHKELTEASLQNGASPLQVLVTAATWGAFLLRRDESPEGGPRWLLETRTQGRLARKLLELGRNSGVSIVVDETVARRLSHLTPGDPLPADLADVLEAQG
jgi:type III secretory pathway component EscU